MRRVVLITGLQAAGKSTVGRLLAQRLEPRSVSFDGDVLYNMVLTGNVDMTPTPDREAVRQVRLRYAGAALLAQHYADNGFDFVYSDIVMGDDAITWLDSIRDADVHLVVLDPSIEAIAARERARGANSYRDWRTGGRSLEHAVAVMHGDLARTPACGLWLDTSHEGPEETVVRILADDMRASLYRRSGASSSGSIRA
jgi:chloramphenicol 3-O-phosphotransferase